MRWKRLQSSRWIFEGGRRICARNWSAGRWMHSSSRICRTCVISAGSPAAPEYCWQQGVLSSLPTEDIRRRPAGQVEGVRVSITKGGALAAAAEACVKLGLRRVAIESEHLTVAQLSAFEQALGKGVKVVRLAGAVEELRALKDADEIELLRHAVRYPRVCSGPCCGRFAKALPNPRLPRSWSTWPGKLARKECHLKRLSPPAHARRYRMGWLRPPNCRRQDSWC